MSGQRRPNGTEPGPSEQEQAVLQFLLEQRYATSRQLTRAARARYGSDRSAARQTNRLLQKLGSIGLLHVLPRTVGGHARGSSAGIWTITNRGARLAGGGDANPEQRKKRYRRDQDPSLTFLEHTLAISELRVQLAELADSKQLKVETITPEPACWRPYLGPAGQRVFLKPDLAVITSTPDGYEDHWFLEVDLATENPARIVAKCRQYQHYRRSGLEQRRTGLFPAVVWITPTTLRRDQLARRIASEPDLDDQLFTVIRLDDFQPLLADGAHNYNTRKDHPND